MAAGGTAVAYGPLVFYNVLTKGWDQEVQLDDSQTDALFFRYKIHFAGFLHGLPSAVLGTLPNTGDANPGNQYAQLRYLLGLRQHFEYRVGASYDTSGNVSGGIIILQADPANIPGSTNVNLRDVENGPKTKVFSITSIASDASIRVEMEIEVCQLNCTITGETPNTYGVLNNRWSVIDRIDRNFMTTRTFSGKLRASSSQVNVNAFRGLVVPPLQPGMRRESMDFVASEDGLNLLYSITDKEVAFAPPAPATTWSASFSEDIQYQGQLGYYSHADITLGGDRYVDKQKLIAIAASMAESKFQNGIRLLNANQDNSYYVQSIQVIDEYSDDASFIHLRATAKRLDASGKGMLGLQTKNLGVPIGPLNEIADVVQGYDPRFSRDSRPGEVLEINGPVSMVGAFMSYLQSPCVNQFSIAQGIQANQNLGGNPGQGNLPVITAVVNNGITDDTTLKKYSSENSDAYESWSMETHDTTESNRVQAPVAVTGSGGQPSLGDSWWNGTPPPPSLSNQTSVVISLAPPTTERHVTAFGTRVGSLPTMPSPQDYVDSNGTQCKVKSLETSVGNPTPTADGKYVHRVECNIRYAVLNALTLGAASVFTGLNPWSVKQVYKVGKGGTTDYQDPGRPGTFTIPFDF